MNLLQRVIQLEKRSEGDRPYAFALWRECDGETEEDVYQKYRLEHGHDFPDYGLILRIVRAIKPNEDEV